MVPHLHPFTSSINTSSFLQQQLMQQSITLHCRFSSKARLAYLLDHVVMGRPLLPAAAMMELASATAATLTQDAAHEAGALLAVSNMSISAPIILPTAGAGGNGIAEEFEVVCRLDLATGQLSIGYTYEQEAGFGPMTCATATASLVHAPQTQRQHSAHLQAAAAVLLSDLLPRSTPASQGSAAAAAGPVGVIAAVSSDWASSGYFSAPQQVDSALHLGVVAPGSGAKVPVAVGSFLVPVAAARTAGTGQLHASTCSNSSSSSPTGAAAGLSSSSFKLSSDSSTGGAFSAAGRMPGQAAAVDAAAGGLVVVVEDLQTKVVKKADLSKVGMQRQPAAATAGQEQQQTDDTAPGRPDQSVDEPYPCSYETEWQAKEAATAAGLSAVDSRHAGNLCLLVNEASAAAGSQATRPEHLVFRLSAASASDNTLTPAAAAASALAVLQQVNHVQQAHTAAGSGQQLSIHAAISPAGSTLGPAQGLQRRSAAAAVDASNALWGLLRTEATEQTSTAVSLLAVDSTAPTASQGMGAAGGAAGALQASAVMGGALEVPRLLPCSRPEGAEFITVRPEPRSALSNLAARAADISQVSS